MICSLFSVDNKIFNGCFWHCTFICESIPWLAKRAASRRYDAAFVLHRIHEADSKQMNSVHRHVKIEGAYLTELLNTAATTRSLIK